MHHMKKILFFILFNLLISCNNKEIDYHINVETYKKMISEINEYFINHDQKNLNISKYYTANFVFHSYPAGHKKGIKISKKEYISNLKALKNKNIAINIGHSIYLPGLNEKTFDIDGSVRLYYGATINAEKREVNFSGYQTINFDDGKISEIWEWKDNSGISIIFPEIGCQIDDIESFY